MEKAVVAGKLIHCLHVLIVVINDYRLQLHLTGSVGYVFINVCVCMCMCVCVCVRDREYG